MRAARFFWAAGLAAVGSALVGHAAAPWPAFSAGLSGEWVLPGAGTPVITWRVEALNHTGNEPSLHVKGEATGGALAFMIAAGRSPSGSDFTWHLAEMRVQLGPWLGWWRSMVPAWPADLKVDGTVMVTGKGDGGGLAGKPRGRLTFKGEGLTVNWPEHALGLRQVTVDAEAWLDGTVEAKVHVPTGAVGPWEFSELNTRLVRRPEDGGLTMSDTTVRIAGGRVALGPFSFDPAKPQVHLDVNFDAVRLEAFAALLPEVVAEVAGALSGRVKLTWSEADGLAIGGGSLALAPRSVAELRLRPVPGLITGQLAKDSPAYAPLQRVELGRTPMAIHSLVVTLAPDGDGQGRSAILRIEAEPIDPGLKAPIVLVVNVTGPLNDLIRLGMDERVKFTP